MVTACLSMMLHLLLLLIRIAMKLRLSIPLVYLVLMLTAFRPWYRVHATLADGILLVMLVCARLRHVAGTQWGCKKYMNMKHLEAALDDASIAG